VFMALALWGLRRAGGDQFRRAALHTALG